MKNIIFFLFFVLLTPFSVEASKPTVAKKFKTPIGLYTRFYETAEIALNDQIIFKPNSYSEGGALPQAYGVSEEDFELKKIAGKGYAQRVLVSENVGGCIRKLSIIDFSKYKPCISERFGGEGESGYYCLAIKSVDWGETSVVELEDGSTYKISGGKVVRK